MSRPGEFEWISKYLAPLAGDGAFGLKDDAALLATDKSKDLVITQDAILETVHFFSNETPALIARKALRVNASDLIAKGATPVSYSMAIGIPESWTEASMALFADGLARDQKELSIQLTGGDTFVSPKNLSVAVTMLGEIEPGKYVSRLGARPGDILCTTGTIGDAAIGLWIKSGGCVDVPNVDSQWLIGRHQVPRPPLGFQSIVSQYATASMDISDGLLGDLAKLCGASGVGAWVERNKVPLSLAVQELLDSRAGDEQACTDIWKRIVAGGDDYQVLFTVSPENLMACRSSAGNQGYMVTAIGEITDDAKHSVSLTRDGVPMSVGHMSYTHF